MLTGLNGLNASVRFDLEVLTVCHRYVIEGCDEKNKETFFFYQKVC